MVHSSLDESVLNDKTIHVLFEMKIIQLYHLDAAIFAQGWKQTQFGNLFLQPVTWAINDVTIHSAGKKHLSPLTATENMNFLCTQCSTEVSPNANGQHFNWLEISLGGTGKWQYDNTDWLLAPQV